MSLTTPVIVVEFEPIEVEPLNVSQLTINVAELALGIVVKMLSSMSARLNVVLAPTPVLVAIVVEPTFSVIVCVNELDFLFVLTVNDPLDAGMEISDTLVVGELLRAIVVRAVFGVLQLPLLGT